MMKSMQDFKDYIKTEDERLYEPAAKSQGSYNDVP